MNIKLVQEILFSHIIFNSIDLKIGRYFCRTLCYLPSGKVSPSIWRSTFLAHFLYLSDMKQGILSLPTVSSCVMASIWDFEASCFIIMHWSSYLFWRGNQCWHMQRDNSNLGFFSGSHFKISGETGTNSNFENEITNSRVVNYII